jgi:hypothetical protein
MALATVLFWFYGQPGSSAALRTLVITLSVLMRLGDSGRALQTPGSRNDGRFSNVMLAYEVAGTVHFSGKPVSSFRNLQTYGAIGGNKFEQAVETTLGGPIDYLFYYPGAPFDADSCSPAATQTGICHGCLANPGAYLHHRPAP